MDFNFVYPEFNDWIKVSVYGKVLLVQKAIQPVRLLVAFSPPSESMLITISGLAAV